MNTLPGPGDPAGLTGGKAASVELLAIQGGEPLPHAELDGVGSSDGLTLAGTVIAGEVFSSGALLEKALDPRWTV